MGYHNQTHHPRKTKYRSWDGYIDNLTLLGHGVSGMVLAIDDRRVAKVDTGSLKSIGDIEIERAAYRNLSSPESPYVLRCYEVDNPNGLVLERCTHTVRTRLQSQYKCKKPPENLVRNWAYEAVQGLAYVHQCGIIQGDVGCHNMLLSPKNDTLKLADFSGSSVNGSPLSVEYEYWSEMPGSDEPSQQADIFALGSAIFEIATGSPPYEGKSWREVHGLYKRSIFPDVKELGHLGPIILSCWKQEYDTADEILDDLEFNFKLCLRKMESNPSEECSEAGSSSSQTLGRQPASKHKYVDLANGSRQRPGKQEAGKEKVQERSRHWKDMGRRKNDNNTGSLITKSLSWFKPSSYAYQIRVK